MSKVPMGSRMNCPKCKEAVLTNNVELRPGDKIHVDYFSHMQGSVLRVDEPITCYNCALVFSGAYVCKPTNWVERTVESAIAELKAR